MVRVIPALFIGATLGFLIQRCGTTGPTPASTSRAATTMSTDAAATEEAAPPTAEQNALLVRILQDESIWGRDFAAVLRALPAFEAAGENTIVVKPIQVIGRNRYKNNESARPAANRAQQQEEAAPPQFKIAIPKASFGDQAVPPIEPVLLLDDATVRVGTPEESPMQFVVQGIRVDTLIAKYGKPDRIVTEVLDDGSERRPIGLTIYYFAGGAVAFVTADVNDDPRWVDRALLDTRAVARSVF